MKPISRRKFVKATLLFGGAMALPIHTLSFGQRRTGAASGSGALLETPFSILPLGAVKANAWLEHQLWLQAKGITGMMEEYPDYTPETSAWLGTDDGENWERGPYYVRGLVAVAYALNDADLIKKAQRWIDWSLDNQRADGYFGPRKSDSWWARMPMMMAIRDYYEATGRKDPRVMPFFEKYFRYQEKELPNRRLSNWADARGADNIDSILWYYNELLEKGTPESSLNWLIDLARLIQSQTQPWSDIFNNSTVRYHVVNTTQALKYPPLVYRYTKSQSDRDAFANGIFNWNIDHGRIDRLANSDEAARDNQSTRGTETCGVVESMLSTEIAICDYGDASLGDYLEHVAYNALPLTTTPDYSGHTYYALQNQVMATLGNHGFDCDHGDSSAFGAPLGFDCCFSNQHMGWGKFVQSMWMGTPDGGLAVIAYGPNQVSTQLANGKTVAFTQETDYPFRDDIRLTYTGETVAFPLRLRIPQWVKNPVIKVNGVALSNVNGGEFYKIVREFKSGDVIEITFPSEIKTSRWYNDSIAVEKGALIYALHIKEDWRIYDSNDARELKVPQHEEQPLREVYPASRWNYGLVVEETNPSQSFEVQQRPVSLQPFSAEAAPNVLKTKGQIIPEWTLEGNKAAPQPLGATGYDPENTYSIHLIPYACGRLKIAHFPRVGNPASFMRREGKSANYFSKNESQVIEFDNVIVSPASDYELHVAYNGSGSYKLLINGKDGGRIDFGNEPVVVCGLRSMISEESFKFKEQQYNNIRFVGNGSISIIEIVIVPTEKTEKPKIRKVNGGKDYVNVVTNLPRSVATYRVVYGTVSGQYTHEAIGFSNETATITGLKEKTTYYFAVIAMMNGSIRRSGEVAFTVGQKVEAEKDEAINFKDDFSSFSSIEAYWEKFGPADKMDILNGKLVFQKNESLKILTGENRWRNYAYEATVNLNDAKSGDAGLLARVTNAGPGADEYKGIYFGILENTFTIGEADNNWREIKRGSYNIAAGKDYRLKIVAREDMYAFYIDGKIVHSMRTDKYPTGRVGLRSYREGFSADNVVVRPLNAEELKTLNTDAKTVSTVASESSEKPKISGVSAFECVQIKYSRVSAADSYKIEYGSKSGQYTRAVYNVKWNNYKGGRIFTADKFAIGNLKNDTTYYFRLVPLSGTRELTPSDEISIKTNYREAINRSKLQQLVNDSKAKASDSSNKELLEAYKYAEYMLILEDAASNQIEVEVARRNLIVALSKAEKK